MAINSLFPQGREILANFDWIDIISATGYIMFDGINAKDSTGNNYILVEHSAATGTFGNDNRGAGITGETPFITVVAGGGAGPTQCMDLDFNLSPFQLPRTVEGEAFVKLTLLADSIANPTAVQVKAKLRKYSGGEVEIVSTNSTIRDLIKDTDNTYVLGLTAPKTHFKKGDYLRLTIEVWSTNIENIGLVHIPDNTAFTAAGNMADGASGNTRLSLAVPFKLDFM